MKELTDDEIDCMFAYIEENDLDEEIGIVLAENDPTVFQSNIDKAVDYLVRCNLLNDAIKPEDNSVSDSYISHICDQQQDG